MGAHPPMAEIPVIVEQYFSGLGKNNDPAHEDNKVTVLISGIRKVEESIIIKSLKPLDGVNMKLTVLIREPQAKGYNDPVALHLAYDIYIVESVVIVSHTDTSYRQYRTNVRMCKEDILGRKG